jgi:hypothetical protein
MRMEGLRHDNDPSREQEVEAFRKIEGIKAGAYDLATAALVLAGERPATSIDLFEWNDSAETVERTLKEAGLAVRRRHFKDIYTEEDRAEILVARDEETLDRLEHADASKDHAEYGQLMGFPQTAIDVLSKAAPRSKRRIREIDPQNVIQMSLSADHWEEEMEVMRRWNDVIREKTPKLYEKLHRKLREDREDEKAS